jgi:cyclase
MHYQRIIPVLLIDRGRLIKTIRFSGETYIGDPVNAARIFNEKCADEIMILDISASTLKNKPDHSLIGRLASECFMPICYGGGIANYEDAAKLFALGVEKVILNSALRQNCINPIARNFGSSSVAYSLDVRRGEDGCLHAFGLRGTTDLGLALDCAREAVDQGAGEIVLQMIDRDGTSDGYDLEAIQQISSSIPVPLVACGGARNLTDFSDAIKHGASAAAAGSFFVFIGRLRGVLISYPNEEERLGRSL